MKRHSFLTFLSLFTSAGTLVCCALPVLFVSLGLGAVFAGVVVQLPGLIWLSEHKAGVFGTAGFMLSVAGVTLHQARNLPCPIDPDQARACRTARRWSLCTYGFSVLIFGVGAFFSFVAPRVFS